MIQGIDANLQQALQVLPETSQRVKELRQELADRTSELQTLQQNVAMLPQLELKLQEVDSALATENDIFGNTEANQAIAQEQAKLEREREKLIKKASKEDKTVEDLAEYRTSRTYQRKIKLKWLEEQKEKDISVKTTLEDSR